MTLALPRRQPALTPVRPKPDPRKRMTIVLGFACKDTLIFASDSQMSFEGGGFKRWDLPKLTGVRFKNDVYAMIGVAGVVTSANQFRDVFERMAATVDATGPQSIADTAEQAMKETRRRFLDFLDDGVTTTEQKQKHLETLNFAVLLGCYSKGKAHLATSEFWHGLFQWSRLPFETIGCGHSVANFVLSGCDLPSLNFSDALGLAVYAVDRCKKFDDACGGPVQHLMTNEGRAGYPFAFSEWILDVYAKAATALDKLIPQTLIASIAAEVEKQKERIGREWAQKNEPNRDGPS